MRKYFGTDGVRGVANRAPMDPETALRLGKAAGSFFCSSNRKRHRVIIGKDTRLSGYMLESALMSGICSMGADVYLTGPMPTPSIAFLTSSMRADAGIVISASHNPFEDNGIKFFGPNGLKLPDDQEAAIERLMERDDLHGPTHGDLGRAFRLDDAEGRYIVFAKATFPRNLALDGLRIVVDCANGATYKAAPSIFTELGARVISLGDRPDGLNINDGCGSTNPESMSRKVLETGADVGVAFDGDGDRLIMADASGKLVDGDDILFVSAVDLDSQGALEGRTVVGTVMSNMGLEAALRKKGIHLARTAVGDRYVVEEMLRCGSVLGGEPSGHLIYLDHATTGDGIVSALQVLTVMVRSGKPLDQLTAGWTRYPQVMKNIRVTEKVPLEGQGWVEEILDDAKRTLGEDHLLSLRYSGTEPLLRVTVSCVSEDLTRSVCDRVCDRISERFGKTGLASEDGGSQCI